MQLARFIWASVYSSVPARGRKTFAPSRACLYGRKHCQCGGQPIRHACRQHHRHHLRREPGVRHCGNQCERYSGGVLPTVLGTSETRVFIDNYPADLYYVSPTQINFLVPPNLSAQAAVVQVVIDGLAGPPIALTLGLAAPGLFQLDLENAVATEPDGSVLTPASPARPGDIVVLYATGLGEVTPPAVYGQLPTAAAPLIAGANLSILLDGTAVPASAIDYAGVAPDFAGSVPDQPHTADVDRCKSGNPIAIGRRVQHRRRAPSGGPVVLN